MMKAYDIVECKLWDGKLSEEQQNGFAKMKPVIDDMNRNDDTILYSWYEICQWKWKQWEYSSVLSFLDLTTPLGYRVLDAGCGYTALIRYLASIGMNAYGFDLDEDERKSNFRKSSKLLYGDKVKYHKQDIRKMDWQSDFFDYTISVSVFEHLWGAQTLFQRLIDKPFPPPRKYFALWTLKLTLAELIRVTKPGGLVILTMDCGHGVGLPFIVVEKLLGVRLSHYPDVETIRTFWKNDRYYSTKNEVYPRDPREYTSILAVLRKVYA